MAVRYYDIQRIRHLDSIPSTATYRMQYGHCQQQQQQQQQEGGAEGAGADMDLNFDQILTFRNAFMHSVIFFVLEQQVLAEQLENPNSILHLVQHSCSTFQHHNTIPQSANTNAQSANTNASNKAHGCARIFMVPEWNSVLHSLASLQESLSPSKIKLKQDFFQKESTRFLHPCSTHDSATGITGITGATGANTNDHDDKQEQSLDQKRVKQVVRSVFQEWAIQKGIDENDARVVLDALGSLEQIVKSGWSEDGLENVPVENSVKVLIRDFFGGGGDVDVDLDGNGMEGPGRDRDRGRDGREFGEEWNWNDENQNQNRKFGHGDDRHLGATGMDHAAVNGRPVDTIATNNQQQHYPQQHYTQQQQQQDDGRFGGGQHDINMGGDYCSTTLFGGGGQEVDHHANRIVYHSQHRGSAAAAPATPGSRPGSRHLVLSQTKATMGTNRWQQQQMQQQQRQMPQMQQQQMRCSEYEDYDMQMATQHTHMSGEQQGQEYPQHQRPMHSSSFRQQHSTRTTTPPPSSFSQAVVAPRRPAIQSMTPRHQQMQMPMQVPMQMQMQQRQTPVSQMRLRQNASNDNRWMAFRTPQQQNPLHMNNNTGTASAGYSQQSARSVRQRTMQGRYISRDGNGNGIGVGVGGTGGVGTGTGTYERNVNENHVNQNPFQDFNYQIF